MRLLWSDGKNIAKNNRSVWILLWLPLMLCAIGCGNDIAENNPRDLFGWEYTGEHHQYIWGQWTLKMESAWENDLEYWGTYEFLPNSYSFKSAKPTVEDYSVEEIEYYIVSPVLTRFYSLSDFGFSVNYLMMIDTNDKGGILPLTMLFLVDQNHMVGYSGRSTFILEKIEDYSEIVEGKDFLPSEQGFLCGEWEITEGLKSDCKDIEPYRKHRLNTDHSGQDQKEITEVYFVSVEEESIAKLVEAMGLEGEEFVFFCEFSENCFWDKMILKDENTAVLVKDGNYFWAKRISDVDEFGMYGSYL